MIHELPNNYYAVQVGGDMQKPAIINGVLGDNWADEEFMPYETLPSGQWQIVGMAGELTEEQAKVVCPKIKDWSTDLYYNHTAGGRDFRDIIESAYKTALESFSSLLASLSIESNNLLIIKKEV